MALYKDSTKIGTSDSAAFDKAYSPGEQPEYSGIYRCTGCGKEISHNAGVALPPQNHHQHSAGVPIRWKMVVYAQTNG